MRGVAWEMERESDIYGGLQRKLATFRKSQKFGENRFCGVIGRRIFMLILEIPLGSRACVSLKTSRGLGQNK